ncbi:hypothetical protein LCGC14_2050240 [marine sediment metagenome]|uniref:GTP cyclohydrolase I n=1 Tax=marine sediment metagenome TaxID=412755 RepID=A0A0F9H2Q3_9ZZZZ
MKPLLQTKKKMEPNQDLLHLGFLNVLKGLGLDTEEPHYKRTADRCARTWYNELCIGLTKPPPKITVFPTDRDEMVMLRGIPIRSLCAHHLLPFVGTATIAYIPGKGKLLGLSKLSRIANWYARRPQVQEELTSQIADAVAHYAVSEDEQQKGGVGVIIRARHMCMELRGVEHPADMVTSAVRGVFLTKPEARAEFLELNNNG